MARWVGAGMAVLASGCAATVSVRDEAPAARPVVLEGVESVAAVAPPLLSLDDDPEARAMLEIPVRDHRWAVHLSHTGWGEDVGYEEATVEAYRTAAAGYRAFLARYPHSTWSYGVEYSLGRALSRAGECEEALPYLTAVRDSSFSEAYLAEAAESVVVCAEVLAHEATARGELVIPTEPPLPSGEPPAVHPIELPPLVAQRMEARDIYLARVEAGADEDETAYSRAEFLLRNAREAYVFGHWDRARPDLAAYYDLRCLHAEDTDEIENVWAALHHIASVLGDADAVAALDADRTERRCRFEPEPRIYPDTSYYTEHDRREHPWRLERGERVLRTVTTAVQCDEDESGEDWWAARLSATAGPRLVRVTLENIPYNCGHGPVIAARLRVDGAIELGYGDPGDVPLARCNCAFDLVATVRGVPPGEHDVVMHSMRAHVTVPRP
jgi:hypothetical protein